MSTPRRVAVLTTTRADAGPLGPVIAALGADPRMALTVVAGGTHLDEQRGRTIDALAVPDDADVVVLEGVTRSSSPDDLTAALADLTAEMGGVLSTRRPDLLVVLGDRWELLGACAAAVVHQVPIVHLHGGEVTEGALDDRVRAAVTKLSDLHLCATEEARRRLLQLGEEPWRVHTVGAPALDRFRDVGPRPLPEVARLVGAGELTRPFGVVTYHPPTVSRADVGPRARAVLDGAAMALRSAVVTAPGADPGGDDVLAEVLDAVDRHPHLHFVANLGAAYPEVLASADVMVGNSSSGILEAASFRLPVVDVGDRQKGRLAAANVVHVEETSADVASAIERAVDPRFRDGLTDLVNPYGDGRAAPRIVEVMATVDLAALALKRFVDWPAPGPVPSGGADPAAGR